MTVPAPSPPGTRPADAPRVELGELARWLTAHHTPARCVGDAQVGGVCLDSRRVQPGDLYAALPGARHHGATFTEQARAAGAAAVLTDPAGAELVGSALPVLVVEEPRRVLGPLAAHLYRDPADRMRTLAVTGTQGKTTTTRLLDGALEHAGVTAAVVGTVGTRIAGTEVRTSLTTPEAPDLQALFAVMVEHDVAALAMEVSSHALVQGRVDGFAFDVAAFLNLGRDHLDFHADLEEYFAAKAQLFTPAHCRLGVVNTDDEHGRRLVELARAAGTEIRTFALDRDADWRAVEISSDAAGSSFTVLTPSGGRVEARVGLPGRFNVSNALAALALAGEAGFDVAAVATGLDVGVPGRLEQVDAGQDFTLVIDYAHKPDAVRAAVETLRPLTDGKVVVVIGAGGDRDRGKRPEMGRIAAELADLVVVTDDNPRTEDPATIRAEVLAGAREGAATSGAELREIGDRRAAIAAAVAAAAPGDIVLVAGKGHETGQEVHGVVHPFDDRTVAAEEAREAQAARKAPVTRSAGSAQEEQR